jgi:hypothetical protein
MIAKQNLSFGKKAFFGSLNTRCFVLRIRVPETGDSDGKQLCSYFRLRNC